VGGRYLSLSGSTTARNFLCISLSLSLYFTLSPHCSKLSLPFLSLSLSLSLFQFAKAIFPARVTIALIKAFARKN